MITTATAIHRYAAHMRRVKYRTDVVRRCVGLWLKGQSMTGYKHTDMELCFLMLRMICESMMLASVMAHDAFLGKLASRIIKKEWNANKLMAAVEQVNPEWFPVPIRVEYLRPHPHNDKHVYRHVPVPDEEGCLTRAEFKQIYNRCGGRLHDTRIDSYLSDKDVDAALGQVRGWTNKVISLLNRHEIQLSEDVMLSVLMRGEDTGDVVVTECRRLPPDSRIVSALTIPPNKGVE